MPLQGIHPKHFLSNYRHTCTTTSTATLFTEARKQNQPRCPSSGEKIMEVWYMHTKKYYSAVGGNEVMAFMVQWMELGKIILSEVTRASQRQAMHVFSQMWVLASNLLPCLFSLKYMCKPGN